MCAPGRGRIPRRRPPPPPSGRTPGPRRRAGGGAAEAELRQTWPRRCGGTRAPARQHRRSPSLPPSLPSAGGDPQRAGEELRRPPDRLQVLRRRKGGGELREPGGRSLLKSYAAPCRATRSAAPPPQPAGPVAELRGGRSRSPIQGLRQVSAARRGLGVWPEFTSELGRAGERAGEGGGERAGMPARLRRRPVLFQSPRPRDPAHQVCEVAWRVGAEGCPGACPSSERSVGWSLAHRPGPGALECPAVAASSCSTQSPGGRKGACPKRRHS